MFYFKCLKWQEKYPYQNNNKYAFIWKILKKNTKGLFVVSFFKETSWLYHCIDFRFMCTRSLNEIRSDNGDCKVENENSVMPFTETSMQICIPLSYLSWLSISLQARKKRIYLHCISTASNYVMKIITILKKQLIFNSSS